MDELLEEVKMVSRTKPGDGTTARLRVVLKTWSDGIKNSLGKNEYVVHFENMQVGGCFRGVYTTSFEDALKEFKTRVRKLFQTRVGS